MAAGLRSTGCRRLSSAWNSPRENAKNTKKGNGLRSPAAVFYRDLCDLSRSKDSQAAVFKAGTKTRRGTKWRDTGTEKNRRSKAKKGVQGGNALTGAKYGSSCPLRVFVASWLPPPFVARDYSEPAGWRPNDHPGNASGSKHSQSSPPLPPGAKRGIIPWPGRASRAFGGPYLDPKDIA
jgi:hypothetical protein